ncbi:alpha/beta fold hydrolase [Streptomyces sp. NPDC006990]|uniref:alpha/beta fold hydrolase n=1 Tax=Streptomyces sp. NPDC006990 TaxID=3154481 RepID=UPI0034519C1C
MSENGTRTVRTGGVRLGYRSRGGGKGVPVVLLHCLGEDGEDWRGPLIPGLADGHPVHALDLRGHGERARPGSYALDDFVGDLRGFLDALGIDRAVLVGHSFGSVVASLFAQEHPTRVDGPSGSPPSRWATAGGARRHHTAGHLAAREPGAGAGRARAAHGRPPPRRGRSRPPPRFPAAAPCPGDRAAG